MKVQPSKPVKSAGDSANGIGNGITRGIHVGQLTVAAGGKTLLENASATFYPNEISLIVGPSGVGKSILLRIIAGLIQAGGEAIRFNGNVTIDGQPTRNGKVGVVFQSFALFDELSPVKNVEFAHANGGKNASELTSRQWLDQLRVPTTVPTSRLSGGQRQRLAIARTLAFNPSAILYDEPTSGLDPSTGRHVANMIRETHDKYGKTLIVVTHDYPSLIPIADKVFLLDPDQKCLVHLATSEWENIPERLAKMSTVVIKSEEEPQAETIQARVSTAAAKFLADTSNVFLAALVGLVSLIPTWKTPAWGLRFLAHYARLVFGPTAWIYLILAGMISGFVVTYFTFKFLPYATYTEPLLIEDLLTVLGFAMYRIFVPVLSCVLIAARCGAAVTSDVGGRQFGNQIDGRKNVWDQSSLLPADTHHVGIPDWNSLVEFCFLLCRPNDQFVYIRTLASGTRPGFLGILFSSWPAHPRSRLVSRYGLVDGKIIGVWIWCRTDIILHGTQTQVLDHGRQQICYFDDSVCDPVCINCSFCFFTVRIRRIGSWGKQHPERYLIKEENSYDPTTFNYSSAVRVAHGDRLQCCGGSQQHGVVNKIRDSRTLPGPIQSYRFASRYGYRSIGARDNGQGY